MRTYIEYIHVDTVDCATVYQKIFYVPPNAAVRNHGRRDKQSSQRILSQMGATYSYPEGDFHQNPPLCLLRRIRRVFFQ